MLNNCSKADKIKNFQIKLLPLLSSCQNQRSFECRGLSSLTLFIAFLCHYQYYYYCYYYYCYYCYYLSGYHYQYNFQQVSRMLYNSPSEDKFNPRFLTLLAAEMAA